MPPSNETDETEPSSGANKIQNVLIVMAMEAEAAPLVEHLKLERDFTYFPEQVPFHAYRGSYNHTTTSNDHKVTLVTHGKDGVYETGVDNCGTVPAALATFLALQHSSHTIDLVVNAGTCGGFQRMGAHIGDVFLITATAHHDRRIPIPSFDTYGIGHLPTRIDPSTAASALGYKLGVCTTGNSLDATDSDHACMRDNNASVKDMEAAAIAWSCALFDKPLWAIKSVTDIVDGDQPTQDEFLANLHSASLSLQDALPKVLEYICGKEHAEDRKSVV